MPTNVSDVILGTFIKSIIFCRYFLCDTFCVMLYHFPPALSVTHITDSHKTFSLRKVRQALLRYQHDF